MPNDLQGSPYSAGCLVGVLGILLTIAGLFRAFNIIMLGISGKHVQATVENRTAISTGKHHSGSVSRWKVAYFTVNGYGYSHVVSQDTPVGKRIDVIYLPTLPRVNRLDSEPIPAASTYGLLIVGLATTAVGSVILAVVSRVVGPADLTD